MSIMDSPLANALFLHIQQYYGKDTPEQKYMNYEVFEKDINVKEVQTHPEIVGALLDCKGEENKDAREI